MVTTLPLLLHLAIAPVAAAHALIYKRDSRAAFGWIAMALLFPIGGPLLYFAFGINRVRTRARHLQGRPTHWLRMPYEGAEPTTSRLDDTGREDTAADTIARISRAVSGRPLLAGNRVRPLFNGEEAYPEMVAAIDRARHSVYLMTYILETNRTGRRFIDALAAADRRGVQVRVLIDGFGDWYSLPRASRKLREHRVEVARFLPLRLLPPAVHINLRNHRKILVVDGEHGFTGGMNIGDRHLVATHPTTHPTQDIHFAVDGPVVRELEQVFADDWRFATGEELTLGTDAPSAGGDARCRVISTGPDDDIDKLVTVLLGAIAAARHTIDIVTPYFLPPREMIATLQAAALRGVRVTIVLPARSNLPFVHWATRNMLWELLQRSVAIYYQPPPFAHTKLFVVDGEYAQIGSANLDPRSLRLNFELALEIHDITFAATLRDHVRHLVAKSRPVTLEEVDGRSLPVRMRDALCWLLSPFL